jgi:hypothetical protein
VTNPSFPFHFAKVPTGAPGRLPAGKVLVKVIHKAVCRKWQEADRKEWWYTKLTAARRLKTTRLHARQNGQCYFCGQATWVFGSEGSSNNRRATLEHIVCQVEGGTDHMSNLVMSCASCNNLRGDMRFNKFLKLRQDPEAWRIYVRDKARALQERKVLIKEKRQAARDEVIWRLGVFLYLRPQWLSEVNVIHQNVKSIIAKQDARHAQRVANSLIDPEDLA